MRWVEPEGGVVCFPEIVGPAIDPMRFHARLRESGVFVGPGWWFERPASFKRIGFGYPTAEELRAGLAAVSGTLDAC